MIANISPDAQFTDESVSTCHFAQRVALVKNSASVNEEVEPELVIQRLRAEVRRLREEVEFLSGKNDDNEGEGGEKQNRELSEQQMRELKESIHKYVKDRERSSHLDFCIFYFQFYFSNNFDLISLVTFVSLDSSKQIFIVIKFGFAARLR